MMHYQYVPGAKNPILRIDVDVSKYFGLLLVVKKFDSKNSEKNSHLNMVKFLMWALCYAWGSEAAAVVSGKSAFVRCPHN